MNSPNELTRLALKAVAEALTTQEKSVLVFLSTHDGASVPVSSGRLAHYESLTRKGFAVVASRFPRTKVVVFKATESGRAHLAALEVAP